MNEKPFRPLGAERIETTPSAAPVSWFERIAPQISEEAPTVPVEPIAASPLEAGAQGAKTATFADVAVVAARERAARSAPLIDPPEIVALRLKTKAEAEAVLQAATRRAARIEAEAQERGYGEGYARGETDGQRESERLVLLRHADDQDEWRETLASFLAHIEAERLRVWSVLEPQVIALVFALAQKVIKMEVEATRDVALSVVQHALRRVADGGSLRVRVSSADLEAVRAHRDELLSLVDGLRHIEIVDDRRVGPGGAIVETSAGNIDARIETQLEETARLLNLPLP